MNRYQYVTINGTNSDYMNVLCGVPQGSILGPILFILYIDDMCNVSTLLKPILFADDTNLFYSGKDIDELCSVVSIELDKLCIWFQVNKLSLNTSKTNFMIFTNRSCDDTYSVCMNGLNLSRVFVTKFLGVHMDSKLDWNYHIGIVRNKVAKNVSVMNRVKHVLTSSALYSLYSRTPDERPPSPTTIPLIRPHFVWRTGVSVRIRIPHERPSLLYSRTPLIRPPSESHWCGRIRGMVAREGFVYEQKPLSVTRNVVV